jgi:hypothetical protein
MRELHKNDDLANIAGSVPLIGLKSLPTNAAYRQTSAYGNQDATKPTLMHTKMIKFF